MRKQKGLTLVELLIVILIVVFLFLFIIPLHDGRDSRDQAIAAVCLGNMMKFAKSWRMYTDENKGYLIGGDIGQAEFDWIPKPVVSDPTDIEG